MSAERLRWIFAEEREKLRKSQGAVIPETVETELEKAHENFECNDINMEVEAVDRANSLRNKGGYLQS